MTYKQLIKKAKAWYDKELPFVLFCFPKSNEVLAYFQNTAAHFTTETFDQKGFVMAPFEFDKTAMMIPAAQADFESAPVPKLSMLPAHEIQIPDEHHGKEHHLNIVNAAIDEIATGRTKKIVLSRKKDIELSAFDIETLADQIFTKNYNGLKYLWYHPETALWCGTTPETLLVLKDKNFSTMSLAGTKKALSDQKAQWSYKEISEQEIVTSAIFDSLQHITQVVKMSRPYTQQAGNLVHLRTDVSGVVTRKNARILKFVKALHPTPAVCGTPFKNAKSFILTHERYNRHFYTGFLGNINCEKEGSSLFVNLRSMKIEKSMASLYVGGGIVENSDAELEWIETQNKLQTMLKVVAPML
jgi:isochorismate synthase